MKTKLFSNNKNEMSVTKHKNKIVYEKVLVVKSIHNSNDSQFDCLTGYSILFLCYLKLVLFLLFALMLFVA